MQQNLATKPEVIHEACRGSVQRLLFLESSCISLKECPQPIKEKYLLTGPLEPTNRPYALAKIAGVEMCHAYNRQYGTSYIAVMPNNLYGLGDNYDLASAHVIPALVRKVHEAKQRRDKEVVVWGTGTPRREFLYSDDMADACVQLLEQNENELTGLFKEAKPPLVNVGCGEDLTIRELAELVRKVVGSSGELRFDTSKPDGTMRKVMDVSRMRSLGWQAEVGLEQGLKRAYQDFVQEASGC